MRVQLSVVAASLAAAAVLTFPPAAFALSDLVINVDCAGGNRIADALIRPNVLDRRMIIVVNGTCTENVTIERDDVTLKAGASGGGVSAAVTTRPAIAINGARRAFTAHLQGEWDGRRFTLIEDFVFDDGERDRCSAERRHRHGR